MAIEQTVSVPEEIGVGQADTRVSVLGHLRHLLKGSAIYIGGDLVTKALAFILIPLYTRYLTPADYGIIEVVKAVANGLAIVCVLGLNGAMTRFYFDHQNAEARARFLGTTTMVLVGNAFLIVCLFDRVGEGWFERLFAGIPFDPYGRFAIWTVFLTSCSAIPLILYRVREEPEKYVGFQVAQSLLGFGLILYFVAVKQNGALGKLQGDLLGGLLLMGLAVYLVRPHIRLSWSWAEAKRSLKFGAPLVPHLIFWWVVDLSDRLILQQYVTLQEVGIYSLGYNIAGVIVIIIAGLNNAWGPYFFSMSNNPGSKDIIATLLTYGLSALLFVGLVLALFARGIVVLVATPEYYGAHEVIPVIVVALIFMGLSTILINLIVHGRTSHQLPLLTAVAAGVNVGVNFLLIPRLGMMGAAYATVIAMAAYTCLIFVAAQKVYPIKYDVRKLASIAIAFMTCLTFGLHVHFEHMVPAIVSKAVIPFAFALFLWRGGIIRTSDLSIWSRK